MGGFNKAGVPWYAASDTPPIRPKMLIFDDREGRLNRYKANRYLHDYFRANWKPGDRFKLTEPADGYDLYRLLKEPEKYQEGKFITWTGEYVEKRDCGAAYFIYVKFDEGQKRQNGSRFGMFNFYHLAEKVNE